MKRKNLFALSSLLLVAAMTACGGGSSGGDPTPDPEIKPKDYDILVWCAEKAVETTKVQLGGFKASLPEAVQKGIGTINFTVNGVGEGTAAGDMVNDPEKGADVYCFAQDQLSRLVAAGALDAVVDPTLKAEIEGRNDAGSVAAAKVGENLYAFPLTSDNGYFMYYDKTVVTDPTDMEEIVADCEEANKEINFNYTSAWYNAGYFFAYDTASLWTTNEEGLFVAYEDSYDSANGVKALQAMARLVGSTAVVDNSEAGKSSSNSAVLISGTWDKDAAMTLFGENFAVAELPMITDGTTEKHMGSFGGFKLMGAKPQKDATKAYLTKQVANFLTNEANQLSRFKALGWGPSNKAAQANPDVKADEVLGALLAQGEYAVPQGQYPGKWWDNAGAIGSDLQALGTKNPSQDDLEDILDKYDATLDGMLDE